RSFCILYVLLIYDFLFFFFFFQAEDGIRDLTVTGVQTCALPICTYTMKTGFRPDPTVVHPSIGAICCHELPIGQTEIPRHVSIRSEERRVGKECRSQWGRYQ